MRKVATLVLASACLTATSACTGDDPTPPPTDRAVAIYFTRDGKVAPVRRALRNPGGDGLTDTVTMLFEGPSEDEVRQGYATSIRVTAADGFEVIDGTARIDSMTEEPVPDLAVAQLVHTLAQFPDVERVVVDGKRVTRKAVEDETPQILIQSPLQGDVVSSPVQLSGTANVFEATVSIEVRDATGTVVLEAFTTATSGTGTRGTFDTELVLPEAEGTMTIVAFESSAKDGKPLHVTDVQVSFEP